MDFLLSSGSGNHILFLNENTFPIETWHVVRTFVSLQSCVWVMRRLRTVVMVATGTKGMKKLTKIVYIFLATLDIRFPKLRFLRCLMRNENTVQS